MGQQVEESGGRGMERWGHQWKEPERVREYVARSDRQAEERAETFKYLMAVVPFNGAQPLRILDVGSGHGVAAAALLEQFPNSSAVGLDVSEAMMEIGRARMARYGVRFRYHVGDYADGELPADLPGPFDVVVSARAIHHLPPENKCRLYSAIFRVLAPGGCFVNLTIVGTADEYLKEIYRQAGDRTRGRPEERPMTGDPRTSPHGNFLDPVEDHLHFLSGAGFDSVDCFWKQLDNVLVGGYKRRRSL